MNPEMLTIRQVQKILGVSRSQVYGFINDQKNPLPVLYLSERTPRVNSVALLEWIENRKKLNI